MYNQIVLEYFKKLENSGRVTGANAVGKALHKASGDEIHIFMLVDESGKITKASFRAYGSVLAIATSSLACQILQGKQLKQAAEISRHDFAQVFSTPVKNREYVYDLVIEAFLNALKNYYKRIAKKSKKT